jgi:meso-butanediol dehydrogenase/(S,S)-butanediol dehydrogenase/diacetyl reductase
MFGASDAERVAIVTGGSGSMGREIVGRLAGDGVTVVSADLATPTQATSVALAVEIDVTDAEAVRSIVETTVDRFARLDVLVNCAGVVSVAPITEITDGEWSRVLDINLRATFLCCRAALPRILESPAGRIVNIASDVARRGEANMVHYCAAKAGVVGLTQALAMEVAAAGVTVNAICPAITESALLRAFIEQEAAVRGLDPEAFEQELIAEIPAGRPTHPKDIAGAVAWLISPDAAFVTGQALNVSGGRIMS